VAPDLLTIEAAAAEMTVSAATVRRLGRAGLLRILAITPRCHRVDAASLRAVAGQMDARNLRANEGQYGAQQAPVTPKTRRVEPAK